MSTPPLPPSSFSWDGGGIPSAPDVFDTTGTIPLSSPSDIPSYRGSVASRKVEVLGVDF